MGEKKNHTIPGFSIDTLGLDPFGALEVFREEFGDWDIQDQLEKILKLENIKQELKPKKFNPERWSSIIGYQWLFSGIIIFFINTGKGVEIHWSGSGLTIRRRIRKMLKRVKFEDQVWIIRKILWNYIEPDRVKKLDAFFKLKLEFCGIMLAGLTFSLSFFNIDLAWLSSLGAITIAIIWGIYRYGVSTNAIDLRILSIASFYWLILQGFPISLVAIFVLLNLPIYEGIVYSLVLIVTSLKITQWVIETPITTHLLRTWSEIRCDVEDTKQKTGSSFPTRETNLANVAILQYSKGYLVSLIIISSSSLYTLIWISYGFSMILYVIITMSLIVLIRGSWALGIYRGLAVAKEQIEKNEYSIKLGEISVDINIRDSQTRSNDKK